MVVYTKGPRVLKNTIWRGHNRTDAPALPYDNPFEPDVTMPVWKGTGHIDNNVGCLYGISRATVSSVTQSAGAVHSNLTITGQVAITQPSQTFYNCRFTYSYPAPPNTSGGGMVSDFSTVTNAHATQFQFCEWEPSTPGDRYNAIYGHDFKAHRCVLTRVVDGVAGSNASIGDCNVELSCCWIGQLAWFNDDTSGGTRNTNGHTDGSGTHNDGEQAFNGWYHNLHGNFYQGAKYNALNPGNVVLDANWKEFTIAAGNGTDLLALNSGNSSNRNPQMAQCLESSHGNNYALNFVTFRFNWLWNFDHGFKMSSSRASSVKAHDGSALTGSYYPITDVVCTDNTFGGTPRSWGGSQLYYPVRYDSNCTVNGRIVSGASLFYADVDSNGNPCNNVWDPSANVAATYGDASPIAGFPVRHRVDSVPTS